jgi:hypothetical protein
MDRARLDTEPQDPQATAAILSHLSRVPELMERHSELRETVAHPQSAGAQDAASPLGELVWAIASQMWTSGAGNALTWLQVTETGLQPISGHYSLARAALEGSTTARWLVDHRLPGSARRERAARLEAESMAERRRWEDAWLAAHSIPDRPPSFNAGRRLEEHLDAMRTACLGIGRVPSMADRMSTYVGESWSWRAMSAFAHGMPWTIVLSNVHSQAPAAGLIGVSNARVTSNSLLTAAFAITVVRELRAACDELEVYKVAPLQETGR